MAPPSMWSASRPTRRKPPSVTLDESRLLRLIAHGRLVRTFVGGGSQYSINGTVVPSSFAERLIKGRILLPDDPGLLDGVPQSWRVRRPDDGAEMIALDDLAEVARWVAWRNEARRRQADESAVVAAWRHGKGRRSVDMGTRAEAADLARRIVNGQGGGIGIELGDIGADLFLAGVDLDTCIGNDGTLSAWAAAILDAVGSYAEISPSGRGIKAFFYIAAEDVRPFLTGSASPHPAGVPSRRRRGRPRPRTRRRGLLRGPLFRRDRNCGRAHQIRSGCSTP